MLMADELFFFVFLVWGLSILLSAGDTPSLALAGIGIGCWRSDMALKVGARVAFPLMSDVYRCL